MLRNIDPLRVIIYIALLAAVGVRVTYWLTDDIRRAERPRGAASISGRVLDDAGAPVGGARVHAWNPTATFGVDARTDARGAFRVASLPSGTYELVAEKAGYLGDRGNHLQRMRFDMPVRTIALDDGKAATDIVVSIVRGASLAGTVYAEDGRPAAGRYVRILRRDPHFEDASWIDAAPIAGTDDAGRFRVGSLAAGEYVVMAGLTEDGDRRVYHPAAARVSDATLVAIATGEERAGVDLRAGPVATSTMTGVVAGARGPVAGARVDLTSRSGSEPDDRRRVTTTAPDGSFTFVRVQADEYIVSAHAESTGWPGVTDGTHVWGTAAVVSNGRDARHVDVMLAPGRVWSGRLAVSPSGAARPSTLATAPLALSPADAATRALLRSGNRLAARLADDGRFTFAGVPPGRFRVVGMHVDGWMVASAEAGGVEILESTLAVTATDPLPELVVTIKRR